MEFDMGVLCEARDNLCEACDDINNEEKPNCENCWVSKLIELCFAEASEEDN